MYEFPVNLRLGKKLNKKWKERRSYGSIGPALTCFEGLLVRADTKRNRGAHTMCSDVLGCTLSFYNSVL